MIIKTKQRLLSLILIVSVLLFCCDGTHCFYSYADETRDTISATYNGGKAASVRKLEQKELSRDDEDLELTDGIYEITVDEELDSNGLQIAGNPNEQWLNFPVDEGKPADRVFTESTWSAYKVDDPGIAGYSVSDAYNHYLAVSGKNGRCDNAVAAVIRIKQKSSIDKSLLIAALGNTPDDQNDIRYYHSNDFWNGKEYLEAQDASFWENYLVKREAAETVLNKTDATQNEVDKAAEELTEAVDNLISKQNVNASELYRCIIQVKQEKDPYDPSNGSGYDSGAEAYGDSYEKYQEAYEEAIELRDSLYDEDKKPTSYNIASKQDDVDTAVDKLTKAADNAWTKGQQRRAKRVFEAGQKYLPALTFEADKLTEQGYTEQSWTTFQLALSEAKEVSDKYAGEKMSEVKTEAEAQTNEIDKAYRKLCKAMYFDLTPVGEIEISLIATDPIAARTLDLGPFGFDSLAGYIGTVKLNSETGYTVEAALKSVGITFRDNYDNNNYEGAYVYINGNYVDRDYINSFSDLPNDDYFGRRFINHHIVLHQGDRVQVAWNHSEFMYSTYNQNMGDRQAFLFQYLDSLNIMDFEECSAGTTLTVKAGEEFTLTSRLVNAALGSSDDWQLAPNMSFFISNSADDTTTNQLELNRLTNGLDQVISGEDGKVKLTLYNVGCYVITAYDLAEDIKGHIDDIGGLDEAGIYHSGNTGAIIRVKVVPSDDVDAVKTSLISELEEKAAEMPEEQFRPADWESIQTKVEEGTADINEAADLGAARDAQQESIKKIQAIQRAAKQENEQYPKVVREALVKLPDDMSVISVAVNDLVQDLLDKYNSMTAYQKSFLSDDEIAKCEAVKERAASEDYQTPVTFKIIIKNEADTPAATAAIQAMAEWINSHTDYDGYGWGDSNAGDIYHNRPLETYQGMLVQDTQDAVLPLKSSEIYINLDYSAYLKVKHALNRQFVVEDTGVTICDSMEDDQGMTFTGSGYNWSAVGHFAVMVGETEYRLAGISYEGISQSDIKTSSLTVHDYEGNYKGIGHGPGTVVQNVTFPNSQIQFNMPFSDVTVTFNWEPVDLDTLKNNAKKAVNNAYDSYDSSDYFVEDHDEIEAIKDAAIEAIDEATLSTEVTPAKKQAIREMADVQTKAEVKADVKAEIEEKFNAVDTSEMNDDEKAALAKAKEDALKAVDDAEKKGDVTKAGTDADSAIGDIKADSEARIAKEAADAAAADAVIAKIDDLKEVSDLALSDKSTVETARAAYDALTDDQKALIPAAELQKLKNSEAIITALQGKADAETEAAEAEKLKNAAEEAAKAAEQKQKAAEEAAKTAAQKQKEAEEAAKAAAQKQGESEEAAKIAAQKQKEAEEAAAIAAQKQKEAEENAKAAEQKQKEAEDAVKTAEQKQKEAESAAKEAADKLKAAEEALKKAEEDLAKAEQNEFEALAKVKLSKKTKGSKEKITVKWTKVKGAKGYEILIAKNKKGTKSPLTYKAGKKASKKIIKKLKKGRYFVKVRAYKVIKGNTVYGKYSKAKKVNVK